MVIIGIVCSFVIGLKDIALAGPPPWNAAGLGLPPREGISCLDATEDLSRIAIGTIAPPGDPNVFLLDGRGQVLLEQAVGQRWIDQVVVGPDGQSVYCICTMPAGRAGDGPEIFRVTPAGATPQEPTPLQGESFRWYFHYGNHSNHITRLVRRAGKSVVALTAEHLVWLEEGSRAEKSFRLPGFSEHAIVTAMAVGQGGYVLIGLTGDSPGRIEGSAGANLLLVGPASLGRSDAGIIWARPTLPEVDWAPSPPLGDYGTPQPAGDPWAAHGPNPPPPPGPLPQRDEAVCAPLSVAIYVPSEGQEASRPSQVRLAAAEYPGWRRWVRSTATGEEENRGVRFPASRPTIRVYDGQGRELCCIPAQRVGRRGWFDLKFLPPGDRVLLYPHWWTSRALAGQPRLPADKEARFLAILNIKTRTLWWVQMPTEICDVDINSSGWVVLAGWNGQLFLWQPADMDRPESMPKKLFQVPGPCLVRLSGDGKRVLTASHTGLVSLWETTGRLVWQRDLNRLAPSAPKPWALRARAEPLAPGLWRMPGGRVESDLGGQYLIQGSEGLILVEAHGGLSFEREWAAIEALGLDPRQVRYVLVTHEHGDHAPGAYLWRVVTGAKVVASAQVAYSLQHEIPLGTGYGFHPPVPVDIVVEKDSQLSLAGLRIQALRAPGHTFGSMAWLVEREGKRYLAIGDLIMPHGALGYSGSLSFSAWDVLRSLVRLESGGADVVLPGHGPVESPEVYLKAGLRVGRATGWGRIPPPTPNLRFGITANNVVVVGRFVGAKAADAADINADGLPDVAVVSPTAQGAVVRVYLNHQGQFRSQPEALFPIPTLRHPTKLRICHLDTDPIADIMVAGTEVALLFSSGGTQPQNASHEGQLSYRVQKYSFREVHQVKQLLGGGTDKGQILLGTRFSGWLELVAGKEPGKGLRPTAWRPELRAPYPDLWETDVNGDGRKDLVSSYGQVYLREADGSFPERPTVKLPAWPGDWTLGGVGDFDGNGRPDLALAAHGMEQARLAVYLNTGQKNLPYRPTPNATFELRFADQPPRHFHLIRDSLTVADWNADGKEDLIVGKAQTSQVAILLGGPDGLLHDRMITIPLEFRLHHETGLRAADFNADGKTDLAAFGYIDQTSAGFEPALGMFVWLQQ